MRPLLALRVSLESVTCWSFTGNWRGYYPARIRDCFNLFEKILEKAGLFIVPSEEFGRTGSVKWSRCEREGSRDLLK
jgi:aspartate/methionine/tyrosine aminotransferase